MKREIGLVLIAVTATCTTANVFAQSGADIYKSKCAMCHAADGTGSTPAGKSMKTPPLSSPDISGKSDADLIAATKSGKGKMPAYASKLTDPQIKDVIAYVRTLEKK